MKHKLDYENAPKSHLQTWDGMKKVTLYSSIAIVIALLVLAFFFGG